MIKLLKKVIGVDVGAKFLTVSFNDSNNQDQVYNIENNQRSVLSFLKKISSEDYCFVIEATGKYIRESAEPLKLISEAFCMSAPGRR